MILMLLVVGIFFGSLFGWKWWSAYQANMTMASMAMPPVTVSTTVAASDAWFPVVPSVGTLRAAQGVDITAQEAGMITELRFESGAVVEAGEALALQYADDERAQLAALEADVRLAELNLVRAKDLLDQNLSSQFEYDTRRTDRDRAVAQARNLRLRIAKKTIRAPFAGRIGIRQVDVGQYVEPGDPIVRLEALEKILVDFPVSQRSIGLVTVGQPLEIFVDAYPGIAFRGTVSAIAPNVRANTRDVRLEGLIDNQSEQLLPGMFAEVRVQLPTREAVVTLPQSTITYSPYGDSVFVVTETQSEDGGKSLIVENRFVETGETRGDQVAILSGVMPGETVVTAGQIKLRDGAGVVVDNSVLVSNQPFSIPDNN
ncbi:MAG: efflux RND transporter periplasmic adaptor subunit [Gammaproteobacteria bacterium]|nr:efflux RND transporter periplasmic adaptor subunit [Gammaproteobacteria bacterium]MBT8443556.1 efflux RND transporter periplasmic adaptor subunit [Gammaproteobacteria bacterium]